MDTRVPILSNDCTRVILNYCDVSTFEKIVRTFGCFSLGCSMIKDEQEKKRVGSFAWYYSLPSSHNRLDACSTLLSFYRREYHGSFVDKNESYKHPRAQLLAQEFYAIWKLKRETSDIYGGLIENYKGLRSGFMSLEQMLTHFTSIGNNPAVKILLTRSEALKEQLAENQEAIKSKASYDHPTLLKDICQSGEGVTIMNFLPLNEDGTIEDNHFLYSLSAALKCNNNKLITFLIKIHPTNKTKEVRRKLFMESNDDGTPTTCQVVRSLFLDKDNAAIIDGDKNESLRAGMLLAIEKNSKKPLGYMFEFGLLSCPAAIDGPLLHKIFDLPRDTSIKYLKRLHEKGVLLDMKDDAGKTIEEKIDPTIWDEHDKNEVRQILKLNRRQKEDMFRCGTDDLIKLFDKDMCGTQKINMYLKYGSFIFLATIAAYFLFLKFHGNLHNGLPSISNA